MYISVPQSEEELAFYDCKKCPVHQATINNDLDYILKDIYRNDYDVILFSTYIWNVLDIVKLCENIKKVKKHLIYSKKYFTI